MPQQQYEQLYNQVRSGGPGSENAYYQLFHVQPTAQAPGARAPEATLKDSVPAPAHASGSGQ